MTYKTEHIEEDGLVYEVRTYPDGDKQWLYKGKLHRLNGPAIEYASSRKDYWINGNYFYTFEDYKEAVVQIKVEEILNRNGLQNRTYRRR